MSTAAESAAHVATRRQFRRCSCSGPDRATVRRVSGTRVRPGRGLGLRARPRAAASDPRCIAFDAAKIIRRTPAGGRAFSVR